MPVTPLWLKLASATHLFWYRLTGGLVGGRALGAPVLLLTTAGRKSGRPRTTPLLYLEDGEGYVIVASNGGRDNHPAWFLNLRRHPQAAVQIKNERMRVRAEIAGREERNRLWPLVVAMYSTYDEYKRRTKREIPVVVLRPEAGSPSEGRVS